MKRNSVLKGIAVSVALSAFLTGCGSSSATTDNGSTNNDPTQTTSIDGKAIDGYLQYATVCLDLSNDGYCQPSEPSTQTDASGAFTLKLTQEIQSDPNFDTAMLLVYGGKDVDTGDDFTGKLLAPKEGAIVMLTPVSTLVAKQLQKELKADSKLSKEEIKAKIKEAKERVAKALDIPTDALDKDPVEEQKRGNDDLIKKSLQLQKAVEALVAAEPDPTKRDERAEKIYEALADSLADLDPQSGGIVQLLDKTFEKATQDERVKEKLGGDEAIKLHEPAKKVAETIKARFEQAHDDLKREDDFLKKIAIVTKEDLQKIEVAVEEGKEDQISGQISVGDAFTKPDFDWAKKFLSHDLEKLGIEPTEEVISKLKDLFKDERIKPETLFQEAEKLKESQDNDLQNIYQKILEFKNAEQEKEEEHKAVTSGETVPFTAPMSIYLPREDGYGKVSINTDNTLSFTKYRVQADGSFASETDTSDDNPDYVLANGKWEIDHDDSQPMTLNGDGSITMTASKERATLLKTDPIAEQKIAFGKYGVDVTMPQDAQKYLLKIEKTDDTYRIYDPVKDYTQANEVPLTSFAELIEKQCGNNWFIGNQDGGIAFAGTKNEEGSYSCDTAATEGKLVHAYKENGEVKVEENAGTWKIETVDGQSILVVKPYDIKRFKDEDNDEMTYPIFAVKEGQLYRGEMEPKGPARIMPVYNESAMQAITQAVTQMLQENLKEGQQIVQQIAN